MENFTNNKRVLAFLGIVIFFAGCGNPFVLDETKDKYLLKYERWKTTTVEMFTYSSAYSSSPTYVVAEKAFKKDTICVVSNIIDFDLDKDTLWLSFYGSPKLYSQQVTIDEKLFNEKVIMIDTTGN